MSLKRWTKEEERSLVQLYEQKVDCAQIAQSMSRSTSAVRHKVRKLGLLPANTTWQPEENAVIESLAGNVTINKLMGHLRTLWKKRGWRQRSRHAVEKQIYFLGYSRRLDGDYYSGRQVCAGLKISPDTLRAWANNKEFKTILKPVKNGKTILFHRKNLREFYRLYPGEFAKKKPDILWLHAIVFD